LRPDERQQRPWPLKETMTDTAITAPEMNLAIELEIMGKSGIEKTKFKVAAPAELSIAEAAEWIIQKLNVSTDSVFVP
jgi:hypothetical protein